MTRPLRVISTCRHVATEPTPDIELPAYLGATERNVAAQCSLCGIIFMAVRTDSGYRDYRDVDFGGRRP